MRRRWASSNSYNLFKNTSAFTGKQLITIYPPASPYKIYEHQVWYADGWNPLDYARDYDASHSFFEQFHDLQLAVPRPNLSSDKSNINSDYTNTSRGLKNCYIVFDQVGGEDLYYHQCCVDDKNCVECWALYGCDTCYECKLSERLFKCFFIEHSEDCLESAFLWDCRNCDHCFMSSNLRNKKYYFRNEYVGKEEYERRIRDIYFGDYHKLQDFLQEFKKMKIEAPKKPNWNERSENISGDFIRTSKNIYMGLYIEDSENIAYSDGVLESRDSYDISGFGAELCYEMHTILTKNNYGCKFSTSIDNCQNVEYSDLCRNCRNCFGCVGLSNKEFCIFNEQYSTDEYWRKVDDIKIKMLEEKEYGEFFPPKYLVFPYHSALVTSYPGFDDFEEAGKYGYDISLIEEPRADMKGDIIEANNLPSDIKNVGDDILDKIIFDKKNDKKFRIIKQELDFYRQHGLPLPREHPSVRMDKWRKLFGIQLNFYSRKCMQCAKVIETSYSPDDSNIVYCESCYQKALS